MNTRFAIAKSRAWAKALNNPGGHAKSTEKGHRIPTLLTGVDNQKFARISLIAH